MPTINPFIWLLSAVPLFSQYVSTLFPNTEACGKITTNPLFQTTTVTTGSITSTVTVYTRTTITINVLAAFSCDCGDTNHGLQCEIPGPEVVRKIINVLLYVLSIYLV